MSLGAHPPQMARLAAFGVVLGLLGGVAAFLVVHAVGLLSNLALLHRVGFNLPDLRYYHPGWVLIPEAVGGAIVVSLLALWAPIIKGHGIPESIEAILFRQSRISPRAALAKPISAAVAMGTGGPFGAEGPIIVTGAALGSLLGQLLPTSPAERKILLATGAAAGMAGVFATPVAGVVLAFELLLFERSLRALLPLLLATSLATELHDLLIGDHPLFAVIRPLSVPGYLLPLFAVLGLAVGLLAVGLNRGLFAMEAGFRAIPVPEFVRPLIGAVGFALVGLVVPGTLSVGYWAITDAVNGRFLLSTALALCAGKALSWWLGLGSNTSGGTLAPMFLIGATMGEAVGVGFAHLFPTAGVVPAAFALAAMGATFGVGARALLTGAVFAVEVTGAHSMIVPVLLTMGVAELIAERFLDERVMTDKLRRRGYRVDFDAQTDALRTRVSGAAMAHLDGRDVRADPGVDRWDFLSAALPALLEPSRAEIAVLEHGRVVGSLSRQALLDAALARLAEDRPQPATLRLPQLPRRPRRSHRARRSGVPTGSAEAAAGPIPPAADPRVPAGSAEGSAPPGRPAASAVDEARAADPREPDPREPDPGEPDPREPGPREPGPREPGPGEPDPREPDPRGRFEPPPGAP